MDSPLPRQGNAGIPGVSAAPGDPAPVFAAIDLGTNNCRLLIARPHRDRLGRENFRVIEAFSRIVRLGEGLSLSGRLSDAAMARTIEALKICSEKMARRNVAFARAVATEACRRAANGAEFLHEVKAATGIGLDIISTAEEARLALTGCAPLLEAPHRQAIVFDIGGGSSEIAVLQINGQRSPRLANHITHWTSLPVGVVTLSERHGGRHVTPEIFEDMVQEVGGMLSSFEAPPAEDLNGADSGFHMIGTSGTVTTLAGVHLNLPRYERRHVDGCWLEFPTVIEQSRRLAAQSVPERALYPCIGEERADLVVAGCAILEALYRFWPATRLRVADRGVREGVLVELMRQQRRKTS